MKYYLKAETELLPTMVTKYIELDKTNKARLQKLFEYYKGNQAILNRVYEDSSKPNNKVVNTFANYITDLNVGYFMGIPVQYSTEDEVLDAEIKALFTVNDEQSENAELAKNASIFGEAVELMYLDEQANIRFKSINPIGTIAIYDTSIDENLLYFIRYYDYKDILTGNTTTYVDVYSSTDVKHYEYTAGGVELKGIDEHAWKDVPVIIFENNEEEIGDFEPVIELIDAYDSIESNSINDNDYFSDAYLLLTGMEGTTSDDITAMKENRVLLLPEDGKAEWLIKQLNDTSNENLKTRIAEDIHKFSFTPAMTDENFAQNASGVAMKYKLMGLENKTAKKERAFKKALQRRLKLICNINSVMGTDYDYRSINMKFTRNIPQNLSEIADTVNKLGDLYSDKTKMQMLPVDVDYEQEEEQKKLEAEQNYSIDFDIGTTDEEE
jgi:SPP1 family phage portal protein